MQDTSFHELEAYYSGGASGSSLQGARDSEANNEDLFELEENGAGLLKGIAGGEVSSAVVLISIFFCLCCDGLLENWVVRLIENQIVLLGWWWFFFFDEYLGLLCVMNFKKMEEILGNKSFDLNSVCSMNSAKNTVMPRTEKIIRGKKN